MRFFNSTAIVAITALTTCVFNFRNLAQIFFDNIFYVIKPLTFFNEHLQPDLKLIVKQTYTFTKILLNMYI